MSSLADQRVGSLLRSTAPRDPVRATTTTADSTRDARAVPIKRMIVGVGIDVCDVDRFAASIERRPGLVRRIFTTAEAERPMASKAARFAAKEALAKALGAPDGLSWLDAEVLTDDDGRPSFKIKGTVAARPNSASNDSPQHVP